MKFRYLLPLFALVGFSFAVYKVVNSNKPVPVAPAVVEPAFAPFKSFIAGSGIVEAKDRNVNIGTPLAGIIRKVIVKVGDQVAVGSPLFYLDDREAKAQLAVRHADLLKAKANVKVAEANVADSRTLSQLVESVTDKRAISREELLKRRNALAIAKANLSNAQAAVKQVEAAIIESKTTLERLVIRAPMAGEVLQLNIRAGEFAQAGGSASLLVLGNLDELHVRVDIDENDAWRFDPKKPAIAYLRGNRDFKVDLTLAYIEPFVVPKKSLTGDSTERVDTRVLQALYSFHPNEFKIYVGQQMDVFIEANDYDDKATSQTKPAPIAHESH